MIRERVRVWIGEQGQSLPSLLREHRYMWFFKRAVGSEDELYVGLADASDVMQARRIVTTTLGAATYAPLAHAHITEAPAPMPGLTVDAAGSTTLVSNTAYAVYLGVAKAAYTSISTRWDVTTLASTITWAEVGIGTSPVITLNGAASITRRGFTDVSASFNSTGEKTVATTVSGIAIGDHLWALAGSQATQAFQILASVGGALSAGNHQQVAATRISTMASPTAFSCTTNPVVTAIATMWIGT